jgi:hypothetical protein
MKLCVTENKRQVTGSRLTFLVSSIQNFNLMHFIRGVERVKEGHTVKMLSLNLNNFNRIQGSIQMSVILISLLHIQKVLDSNLGPETNCLNGHFSDFISSSRNVPKLYPILGHDHHLQCGHKVPSGFWKIVPQTN